MNKEIYLSGTKCPHCQSQDCKDKFDSKSYEISIFCPDCGYRYEAYLDTERVITITEVRPPLSAYTQLFRED
jgi:Zn ribbon nucleic-acid-binding protein